MRETAFGLREKREIKMSIFDEKIASARAIIENYNSSPDKEAPIDFDEFLKKLKAAGGVTDAALTVVAWEDFDGKLLPKLPAYIARQISNIFRVVKSSGSGAITEKRASVLSHAELLAHYASDKFNAEGHVGKRLQELSKGGRFLVFKEDNTLNQEASLVCLDEIVDGHEPREVFIGNDGVPYETYPVGHKPNNLAPENPLLRGEALRGADEACSKTHRKWSTVPQKIRVLLRLALDSRELVIDQVGRIHDTLDLLVGKTPEVMLTTVNQRFPKAALKYRELEAAGNLPTLKINKNSTTSKKQDPFFGNR